MLPPATDFISQLPVRLNRMQQQQVSTRFAAEYRCSLSFARRRGIPFLAASVAVELAAS